MMQRRELVTKAGIALSVCCSMPTSSASANGSALGIYLFTMHGSNDETLCLTSERRNPQIRTRIVAVTGSGIGIDR